MKKLLLITALSFVSFGSFAKRVADLSISMTDPSNSTVITTTQAFNFTATITNNGPDVLKTTDTLVFAFLLDNSTSPISVVIHGQTGTAAGSPLTSQIPSGGTASLNVSIAFATNPGAGTHNFCVIAAIQNRSADSVQDAPSNNKSCATITVQNPTAVLNTVRNNGVTSIYPNPASAVANIGLNLLAAQQVSIMVTDLSGRVVYNADKGIVPAGASALEIDTRALPTGTYLYNVTIGDNIQRGRLVVAH